MQDSAGVSGGIDEFPIIPSGVTVTNNGTFTKTDLGNNKTLKTFDGSGNYISLTDNDAWEFYNNDFTIHTWLYRNDSNNVNFITQYESSTLYMTNGYDSSTGRLLLYWQLTSTTAVYYYAEITLQLNTWYNIVFQRSGNNTLIFVNNVQLTVITYYAWTTIPNISAPLLIGKHPNNPNSPMCYFKDLMIFKKTLTQAEIKLLMIKTHPTTGTGIIPGPYDYWRNY